LINELHPPKRPGSSNEFSASGSKHNDKTALSCGACGAPLDIRNVVSESGWREAPRIRDMTAIHFNSSTCQVEGEIVPTAEINLGADDSIFSNTM